ncbi:MAG: dihydrolipoyl dehydrogenase [Polyangiaceae bacterium]|nr:dihydrolipoyl dehydrogenase [Polyangiaceae bacterium]
MNERIQVDVAVIGAGTAGLAAYRAAKAEGARTVLIEGGPYGTTCARVGCMPSKLLIAAADAAHRAQIASALGVKTSVEIDGRAVMDRVRRERDRFVGFVLDSVEEIPEIDRLRGWASFVSPGVLAIRAEDGGETTVHARSVVIATGSTHVIPPMFDDVRDRLVTNDEVFAWTELPRSVVVFGTGVIGLELGQALHRLGVRVRIFGHRGGVGHITDPTVRSAAREIFEAELALHARPKMRSVRAADKGGVTVVWESESGDEREESFDVLLAATGRRPNLGALELERAGVHVKPVVNRNTLQYGESSVFIAGDANGEVPLLHEAADEGKIAGKNAAHYPNVVHGTRRALLAVAFTDPGIATVGPSYAELAAHGPIVSGVVRFENQGRSRIMLDNRGALAVYADPRSGRLLGAEMAAPRAEHLAHLLAWALQAELTIEQILAMPFYHPVIEEGLRTALRDAKAKLDAST